MMNLLEYLMALGLVTLILSAIIVRYYASQQTSFWTLALTTISFALGFSGTVLLPIDLSLTEQQQNDNNKNNDEDDNFTMLPWHIIFWSTFILAWIILPVVREMILSGEFTIITRFRDAMRKTLRSHLILLALGIVGIGWLAIHLHEVNVIPVLITLGNTYGLILVALLLGYGLVAFPRSLWRQARPEHELRKVQLVAVKADDALFEAVWSLQDVEYEIDCAVAKIVDLDENLRSDVFYKYCVNELLHTKNQTAELGPELHVRRTTNRRQVQDGEFGEYNGSDSQKPTLEELVRLNRNLKRAQENLFNKEQRWNAILDSNRYFSEIDPDYSRRNVADTENDAMVASNDQPLSPRRNPATPLLDMADAKIRTCRSNLRYIWIRFLRSFVYRVAAVLAAILSMAILWSEATLASKFNLSPFALVQEYLSNDDGDQNGILFQIAALIPLLYMSICVSNGLFQVGRFGPYCLRGNRQSHGVALVFNAQYLVRLQFSLAYNYLLMLKYDTSETAFSKFIGKMDVVPLFGNDFPVYAPLLILLLCAFTLCNLYAKILNVMGFDHQDALLVGDPQTLDTKVNEGKTLLRQYMNNDGTSAQQGKRQPRDESGAGMVELSQSKSWTNSIV